MDMLTKFRRHKYSLYSLDLVDNIIILNSAEIVKKF